MIGKVLSSLGLAGEKVVEKPAEDRVRIPSFPYQNIYGALGIQTSKSTIEWERCRDRFQTKTEANPVDSFLFYHKDGAGDNVIEFLRTFEEACNCPADQRVTFKKTTNKNVLFVGVSEWWKYRVRRSLLTALLRCGQNYTERNATSFWAAVVSEYYLANNPAAVEAFLDGRTAVKMKKTEGFGGWYAYFGSKSRDQIDRCLVKLKRKRKEPEAAPEEPAREPAVETEG